MGYKTTSEEVVVHHCDELMNNVTHCINTNFSLSRRWWVTCALLSVTVMVAFGAPPVDASALP